MTTDHKKYIVRKQDMFIKITQNKSSQINIINIIIIQINITEEHKWIILTAFQEEVIGN